MCRSAAIPVNFHLRMSPITKKLPVAISLPSGRIRGSDFLVPQVTPGGEVQFIGIRSGRPASHGVIVYTGAAVTASDIMERAAKKVDFSHSEESLLLLNRYLDALQGFRIGNVLTIRSVPTEGFRLEKVAERPPPFTPPPKLPG